MSSLRTFFAMLFGAAAAGLALRVRAESKRRGVGLADVVSDLPNVVSGDITHVSQSARAAFHDGTRAARQARLDIEQVVQNGRRTKGQYD